VARVALLLLGTFGLIAAHGPAPASAANAGPSARLVVKGQGSEGTLRYLTIQRSDTGATVLRRTYRGHVWLNTGLAAGRYRLVSHSGRTDRCAANIRLKRGISLRAVLRFRNGSRCQIRVSPPRIELRGQSAADRRLAQDLLRYLQRNAGIAPWYPALRAIEVRRTVFTVRSSLRRTKPGRGAAGEICSLIQGADVADFTPGHAVRGRDGRRIRRCPTRRD